jgi:hypothetical protein
MELLGLAPSGLQSCRGMDTTAPAFGGVSQESIYLLFWYLLGGN